MLPESRHLTLADIAQGMSARAEFTVTPADMQAFAALSGDYNPLHTDAGFAQAKKFNGAVVYGALIVARISQLIGMRLPGRDSVWSGISMQFRQPLYVGQRAAIEGKVTACSQATGMVELEITVRAEDKLLASGKAEVVLVRG